MDFQILLDEYFPECSQKEKRDLLWGLTSFPFRMGKTEEEIEAEFRKWFDDIRSKLDAGKTLDDLHQETWDEMGRLMDEAKKNERD